jgi:hypothetical protein
MSQISKVEVLYQKEKVCFAENKFRIGRIVTPRSSQIFAVFTIYDAFPHGLRGVRETTK